MSCDIKINHIIFEIEKIKRLPESIKDNFQKDLFIFIGNNLSPSLKKIIEKLNKKENPKTSELNELKNFFPNYYENWLNYMKDLKHKKISSLLFIFHSIYLDDSINDIRKKIFLYLSEPSKNNYILPIHQELWINNKENKNEIIGIYYENSNDQKINMEPCVYSQPKENSSFRIGPNFKVNTGENNMLIQDLLDSLEVKTNKIYMCDLKDEENYLMSLYKKQGGIPENIKNTYIRKHYPFYKKDKNNILKIKVIFIEIQKYYMKEEEFKKKELEILKLNKKNEDFLSGCNIINIQIKVNANNPNKKDNLDLYQIFDYLREKKLNIKTPFIKYGEDLTGIPVSVTSMDALQQNKIKKQMLKDWILKDLTKKMNGISMKRYLRDYDNEPRYLSLSLKKNSELLILIAFENKNEASLKEITQGVHNVKQIINDINKNIIPKKVNDIQYIEPPDMQFNEQHEIFLKENTQIKFINIMIPFKKEQSFNFKELYEFSKKFPSYFYDEGKNSMLKQNLINSIELRYKKISGFTPMSDIIYTIDILKQEKTNDANIIEYLQKKYEKSKEECYKYLQEWVREYSSSKSSKIDSHFKLGIKIEINNQNIKISGITRIYLIPILYNFLNTFMHLYFSDFLQNKKLSNKFVINNKLNEEVNQFNNYSFNITNININLPTQYYGDEDNLNMIEQDNNINKNNIYEKDDDNIETNTLMDELKNKGLLSANMVVPEIKLKCDDILLNKGTCKDACNDDRYFIRRLQMFDSLLFIPSKDKKKKDNFGSKYSKSCQRPSQPVVMDKDPEKLNNIRKDSYTYSISYSTRQEYPRWYICPDIWCSICEIPLSYNEVDKKTINEKKHLGDDAVCKTVKCPKGDHRAIIRDNKGAIYPGFTKIKNPDGFCLPCCYKKQQKDKNIFKECLNIVNNNSINLKNSSIYLLGKKSPLDKERYGLLPLFISKLLNTKLETGYLGYNKGFLKKGIKQEKNNSFLLCILDIFSCDKNNQYIHLDTLIETFIEKLNEDLFRSLHYGNLEILFNNNKSSLTPLENYINYLKNKEIRITHQYLWDFLQREDILYPEGINIFIFENNSLICPFGEDIEHFYDSNKKNMLILKTGLYYEPIYYLEGDGKDVKKVCIFESSRIEMQKLFEIANQGCKNKYDIDWLEVLKTNIKKYDIPNNDNKQLNYKFSYDLKFVLEEILTTIQNKKLNNEYLPKYQLVDSYNKVFGIILNNNFYIPIQPSPIFYKFSYKLIKDHKEIPIISFSDNIKIINNINKYTQLNCWYESKILDFSSKKYIVALVNNYGRIVPITKIKNTDTKMHISPLNYYSDVDEALSNQIIMHDDRIEKINKKNFEDETYNRMRFELSIFIHKNKKYLDEILSIIYSTNKRDNNSNNNYESNDKILNENRKKMYKILNNIFSIITSQKKHVIDYNDYKTPNKRIPCFSRSVKDGNKLSSSFNNKKYNNNENNNKEHNNKNILSCTDDPHCIIDNNSCKLFINKYNLLDIYKGVENYNYYISKIMDELLRYKIKREEILNNDINNIINKQYIPENNNKYLLVNTLDNEDIEYRINQIYFDNKGVFIDNRPLIEESTTKEYAFDKNYYLLSKNNIINDFKYYDLSIYWENYLGKNFKVNSMENNLLELVLYAIHSDKNIYKKNKDLTIQDMKNDIIQFISSIITNKRNKNQNKSKEQILNKYRANCISQHLNKLENFEDLLMFIKNPNYNGCIVDLHFLSRIYSLNIIVLDKRKSKKNEKIDRQIFLDEQSNHYLLLYKTIIETSSLFNLILKKNKYIFSKEEIPPKFLNEIILKFSNNNK